MAWHARNTPATRTPPSYIWLWRTKPIVAKLQKNTNQKCNDKAFEGLKITWIQGKNKSVHPIISLATVAPKRDLLRPPLLRSSKRLRSAAAAAALSAATPKKQTTGDQSLENKPTVVVCVHSS
jgi:hypothetical protein